MKTRVAACTLWPSSRCREFPMSSAIMCAIVGLGLGFAIAYGVMTHEVGPITAGRLLRGRVAFTLAMVVLITAALGGVFLVLGPSLGSCCWRLEASQPVRRVVELG